MTPAFERMIVIASAAVAVLLQVLLAPHIAIGNGMPDFLVVLAMVVAIMDSRKYNCVLPFALGLIYDVVSGGPIGAMAFCLTAFSVASAWLHDRIDNDTIFMGLLALIAGLLLVELSYGVFLLLFGYGTNPIDAFAFRVLPCFLYDLVLSVILYLLASRFIDRDTTSQPMINRLS